MNLNFRQVKLLVFVVAYKKQAMCPNRDQESQEQISNIKRQGTGLNTTQYTSPKPHRLSITIPDLKINFKAVRVVPFEHYDFVQLSFYLLVERGSQT